MTRGVRVTLGQLLSGTATGLMLVCAILITVLVARRELRPAPAAGPQMEPISDWERFAAAGHRLGSPEVPVVLVEFADFQCPACRLLDRRLAEARKHAPAGFAVVYRHLPLEIHSEAQKAAEASECAGTQGRFAEMHAVLFRRQRDLGRVPWREFAADAGLPDLSRFERCLENGEGAQAVARDVGAAAEADASGTPTVIVRGAKFAGAPTQVVLDSVIRETLRSRR